MFEELDRYAYNNRLRSMHPGEKFALAGMTMVMAIVSNNSIIHGLILLVMTILLVKGAGIPLFYVGKMLLLPLLFLVFGVLGIMIELYQADTSWIWSIQLASFSIGVSATSLETAITVFFKSLSAVSCLYFLNLTTPITEITYVLSKLRVPSVLIELMTIIYRMIFDLFKTFSHMFIAQWSRLGYHNFRQSMSSLGQLLANLWVKSFLRSKAMFQSLASRGYDGNLVWIPESYQLSRTNIFAIVSFEMFLLILIIIF